MVKSEFIDAVKEIDATKPPLEVVRASVGLQPAPNDLTKDLEGILKQLQELIVTKDILTIPPDGNLKVIQTPLYQRAYITTDNNSSGPFEQNDRQSYFYLTPPATDWSTERTAAYMRMFSRNEFLITSVHESFPGHYVLGLWDCQAPSKTAKILQCHTNIEGWCHYGEQMMVEQGLQNGDKRLRMIMLHDALLRCCRFVVAIRMHTKGMTLEQGVDFFVDEGFAERTSAENETKRGTVDPTYLVYCLGKMKILALRDEYKKLKGDTFSLKEFHDRFLGVGRAPIEMVRQVLLSESSNPAH